MPTIKHYNPGDDVNPDDAQPETAVVPTEQIHLSLADLEAAVENAKPLNERREEAGLPIPSSMEELGEAGVVIFAMKQNAEAMLRETGELSHGYVVLWRELNAKRWHTTFVGATLLCRELEKLEMPFRARIVKSGRAWTFSES